MAVLANIAKIESGKWKIIHLPKKASTELLTGTPVDLTGGFVVHVGTGSGASDQPFVGIHVGATQSSSDATTALVPVAVPAEPLATMRCIVNSGDLNASTSLGKSFDFNADGAVCSTTTHEPVTLIKYISATEGLFIPTSMAAPAA